MRNISLLSTDYSVTILCARAGSNLKVAVPCLFCGPHRALLTVLLAGRLFEVDWLLFDRASPRALSGSFQNGSVPSCKLWDLSSRPCVGFSSRQVVLPCRDF